MAALTSAGSSMSLDDAPSLVLPSASWTGIRILGTEFTVDIVIFAKGLPTLWLVFDVTVDVLVNGLDVFTFSFGQSSESEAESESLLVVVERLRLLNDLFAGVVIVVDGFDFKLFCDVLLRNRRGGEDFEWGTAELESLSL